MGKNELVKGEEGRRRVGGRKGEEKNERVEEGGGSSGRREIKWEERGGRSSGGREEGD